MPYISQKRRGELDPIIRTLLRTLTERYSPNSLIPGPLYWHCGELNYVFSRLCWDLVREGRGDYASLNNLIGTLECVKAELYRRLAAPYEDQKIKEHGDL